MEARVYNRDLGSAIVDASNYSAGPKSARAVRGVLNWGITQVLNY